VLEKQYVIIVNQVTIYKCVEHNLGDILKMLPMRTPRQGPQKKLANARHCKTGTTP